MIVFPHCKINLGLYIERRRPDGYHDIATVMVPVGWTDVLEIVPGKSAVTTLTCYGRTVDCPPEKNLVMKAYRALSDELGGLPPVDIYLQKVVPDGAGLGGGSADAAATITCLNDMLHLDLTPERMAAVAARVGADCPLFVYQRPMLATGTGTDLTPVDFTLDGFTLLIAKPQGCSIPTARAYAGVTPSGTAPDIPAILRQPVGQWQSALCNGFEPSVIAQATAIGRVKQTMLDCGATYAAMSGSGAAVFGLFASRTAAEIARAQLPGCDSWLSGQ